MSGNAKILSAPLLFAVLQATFSDVHPFCDHLLQGDRPAMDKGKPGWVGRKACARHVLVYTAGQLGAATLVTKALGLRTSWRGLLAGTAVNAVTHYVIDRREPLKSLMRSKVFSKGNYLDHCTVQRRPGVVDQAGPGTALMECDQAVHRLVSVLASLTTALVVTRGARGWSDR
ncbi:hypothetical protein LWC34_18495 [Kibdelosporangium philippinense]|uniref:DUF3307 domain-containing protein n=1 Tax=Kibdelosporangium philippinense TaxID=211113 RepID=A0ABS8ZCP6_9PSEU|nr:hypothetical protein [Kibdelosporangium philippinense]MCE7004798.1 hypothetical protein [Kibdelosporangium philippinense]